MAAGLDGALCTGLGAGFAAAFAAAFAAGFATGFAVGFAVGFAAGFAVGFAAGFAAGFATTVGLAITMGAEGFTDATGLSGSGVIFSGSLPLFFFIQTSSASRTSLSASSCVI